MKLKPLDQQVVVVMGASSGIGREAARQFARRGAKLVLSARGEAALESLAEEIRGMGGEALVVPCDVADFEQVWEVARRAAQTYGRIDTWAHLAGVGFWARLEQTTPEEWRRVIDINLNGQAYGAMVALPYLRAAGAGALIHVTSVEADAPMPLQAAYSASKHGAHAMIKALRMELREEGAPISVTEIKPYGISTPLFDNAASKIGTKPQPLPPLYHPSLAAEAVVYAAEHPVPELTVGGAGRASVLGERLTPWLADTFLGMVGFRAQRTAEPRSPAAPGNLFQSVEEERVEGSLTPKARRTSAYTWFSLHPGAKWALAGLALGAAAALVARSRHENGAVPGPAPERWTEEAELPEAVYAANPT